MDLTQFLAQILGVYILIAGLSALIYPQRMKRAFEEVTKSYVLPYFDGALALLFGLAIVLTHNVWNGMAAVLITLIGWLAVLEGVVMLLLPHDTVAALAKRLSSRSAGMTWAVLAVIVGAYLVYAGFLV